MTTYPSQMSSGIQISEFLKNVLADTYLLYVKTQNFHWNVVDSRFHSLHELFEEQYQALAEAADTIAEQIRTLGIRAPGSMRAFIDLASLVESEEELSGDQMLQQLRDDHEAMVRSLRIKIADTSQMGDEGTTDLLIDRLRYHEKAAWMLRSHIQHKPEI